MELPRVRVEGAPTRCPFCHDEASAQDTVACVACLARHHATCWDEAARCASCGHRERLERSSPAQGETSDRPEDVVTTFDLLRALAPGAFRIGTVIPILLALAVVWPCVAWLARNEAFALFRVFYLAPIVVLWAHAAGWLVSGERKRLLVVLGELSGARWTLFLVTLLLPLWLIWTNAR